MTDIINAKWTNWQGLLNKLSKDKNYVLGCSFCGGRKPWIEDVFKNINDFAPHLGSNGHVVIHALGSGYKKAIGANWVMQFVKQKDLKGAVYEVKQGSGNFTTDIVSGIKSYECKSWGSNILAKGKSNFLDQLGNRIYSGAFTLENSGFYFHPSTNAYPRFSKSGVKGERITKAKLKTAMKTDLDGMVRTENDDLSILSDFFDYNLSDLMTLSKEEIIDLIVDDYFDDIIRNVND